MCVSGGELHHDDGVVAEAVHVKLVGKRRAGIFNDYIAAIENQALKYPRIGSAYAEHLYATTDDLFSTSGHPPDTFVAGALAFDCYGAQVTPIISPRGPQRTDGGWRRP